MRIPILPAAVRRALHVHGAQREREREREREIGSKIDGQGESVRISRLRAYMRVCDVSGVCVYVCMCVCVCVYV